MMLYLILCFLGCFAYAMDEAQYTKNYQDISEEMKNRVEMQPIEGKTLQRRILELSMQLKDAQSDYTKLQGQIKSDKRAEYEFKKTIKLYLFCTGFCVVTWAVALSTLICSIRASIKF